LDVRTEEENDDEEFLDEETENEIGPGEGIDGENDDIGAERIFNLFKQLNGL
jgi:hypothetical protein